MPFKPCTVSPNTPMTSRTLRISTYFSPHSSSAPLRLRVCSPLPAFSHCGLGVVVGKEGHMGGARCSHESPFQMTVSIPPFIYALAVLFLLVGIGLLGRAVSDRHRTASVSQHFSRTIIRYSPLILLISLLAILLCYEHLSVPPAFSLYAFLCGAFLSILLIRQYRTKERKYAGYYGAGFALTTACAFRLFPDWIHSIPFLILVPLYLALSFAGISFIFTIFRQPLLRHIPES